jgi:small subunit ribosomal protein S6
MQLNNYETVFIVTPVLSEEQTKDTVAKFKAILTAGGAEIVHAYDMGLRKLAYQIQNKSTGFYQVFEFKAPPTLIASLEIEYKRDEKILRFLTVACDKHAVAYNEKKRKGLVGKKVETVTPAEA